MQRNSVKSRERGSSGFASPSPWTALHPHPPSATGGSKSTPPSLVPTLCLLWSLLGQWPVGSVRASVSIRHFCLLPSEGTHSPAPRICCPPHRPHAEMVPTSCLASWAGYASPSDGTSMPPPLRSPPRPSFNMTLHPLSPSQCRPQEGKACAGCWGSLPPGLPSSEMPCSTSTAGPCHPALAVCLGRKSTGLRSGGLVLACVGSLPWPGSLAPGLQLAPSSDDAGGTGTHPEGTPTPGWQVRPAQGIWEFKVTGGPSWHAKGVLQEDGTLA